MANSTNSVNLVVQSSTGNGQQIIKIVRNSNGQPLTKEGVKAIVKEVTSQQNLLNNQTFIRHAGIKQESISPLKPTSIKLTPQQLATLKANQSTKIHTAQDIQFRNVTSAIAGTSQCSTTNNTQHVVPSSSATKKTQIGQNVISRRRKTDRLGKGLRHFSMKVCEKVKEKGKTTYNEVADELVAEEVEGQPIDPANYDQKNIRRRVYDALNVLMAMNIISKDKKEIRWIGLPTNSAQQCTSLEQENEKRKERIAVKKQQLRDLILQLVSFKSLVTRNKEAEDNGLIPSQNSAIQLPFIIVNTHKKTHINCSISNDKSEYFFKFDNQFEIHDDIDVLKRMGLLLGLDKGECTYDDIERAKTMVPQSFEKYIEIYGRGLEENSGDYEMNFIESFEPKTEPMSDIEDIEENNCSDTSDME